VVLPFLHLKTTVAGRSGTVGRQETSMGGKLGKSGNAKDMTIDLRGKTLPWHNNHNRETGELKGAPKINP